MTKSSCRICTHPELPQYNHQHKNCAFALQLKLYCSSSQIATPNPSHIEILSCHSWAPEIDDVGCMGRVGGSVCVCTCTVHIHCWLQSDQTVRWIPHRSVQVSQIVGLSLYKKPGTFPSRSFWILALISRHILCSYELGHWSTSLCRTYYQTLGVS